MAQARRRRSRYGHKQSERERCYWKADAGPIYVLGDHSKQERPVVQVQRTNRGGRKYLTVITNLEEQGTTRRDRNNELGCH